MLLLYLRVSLRKFLIEAADERLYSVNVLHHPGQRDSSKNKQTHTHSNAPHHFEIQDITQHNQEIKNKIFKYPLKDFYFLFFGLHSNPLQFLAWCTNRINFLKNKL